MTGSGPVELILFGRPDCHLCHELQRQLFDAVAADQIDLRIENVDRDPQWVSSYGERVPVLVAADGTEICDLRFDAEAFAAFMKQRVAGGSLPLE